ncbi:MAG: flavodoxin domain-containing protein [Dehalococcoidia bacterium]
MKVLISAASRHGSTEEIAEAIGAELRRLGLDAEVRPIDEVGDLTGYDAAVIGSAVYLGRWQPAARQVIEREEAVLRGLPVWLFSSGPLGADDHASAAEPSDLAALLERSGARGHRVFVGKLDRDQLGLGERLVSAVVQAPEGDFRDWTAIRAWADEIAAALMSGSSESL